MSINPTSLPESVTAGQSGHLAHSSTAYAAINNITANAASKDVLAVNVKDAPYSATGNGTTDDTAAFQDAITDAASAKMPLFIPGGHYKLTGQLAIPSGLKMYGAGQEPVNGTPTRLNFSTIASGTAAILINAGSNITLTDFYVTGRTSGSADEISVTGSSRAVVIERVTVSTATTGAAFALAITGGGSHNLIKSAVRNCTAVGAAYGFRVGNSSTSIDFAQCYANANTTAGYLIQGTYITLTSCAADTNTLYGYLFQNAVAVTCVGCGAETNGRSGWHCTAALNVVVIGCRGVSNNTSANAAIPSFVGINDASDYITLIGCVDTTPNAACPSAVSSWNGTAPTLVSLVNNDFTAKGVQSGLRDTLTARTVTLEAGVAAKAPLRIPHGVAPTSPVNGDMWTTTAGLFVRINGATVGPLT